MAAKLGRYHRAVRRRQPGEELPDWIPTPEILAGDSRLDYVDAFTLLGDAMHPTYRHPKTLARAYDQVYYEGREMGNLPLRGKKMAAQSAAVYRVEYAQIIHHFSTLTRIDCEKFVRLMPTSLVHPEDEVDSGADMMTPPRMISHSEIVPDTMPMPTTNHAPAQYLKVQVIPTGDPEGMTGGLARALTQDLQGIRKKAWALN